MSCSTHAKQEVMLTILSAATDIWNKFAWCDETQFMQMVENRNLFQMVIGTNATKIQQNKRIAVVFLQV